ncbi:MAG TPA: response regulator transcription factor, partial [Terriglobales bacterium]
MTSIRILLVEDHFMARMALRSILSGKKEFTIVGEAENGEQAISLYGQLKPDVTLMDLRLPGISGFEVITALKKQHRSARIVVLTNYEGSEDVYRALRNGAMAYLTKDASGQEVVDAVLTVHQGLRYLPRAARDRLAERTPCLELTPREHQVLTQISRGQSNREIAESLQIAEKTVRIHVSG